MKNENRETMPTCRQWTKLLGLSLRIMGDGRMEKTKLHGCFAPVVDRDSG